MNTVGALLLLAAVAIGVLLLCVRRLRIVGAVILLGSLGGSAFFLWQGHQWAAGYERLVLGESEQEVLEILGTPPRITDGTDWVEPGSKKSPNQLTVGCVKEYWYNEFYAPVAYAFCFDAKSTLISKYLWASW